MEIILVQKAVVDSQAMDGRSGFAGAYSRTLPYIQSEPRSRMNAKINPVARLKTRAELPMLHDSSRHRSPRRGARRTEVTDATAVGDRRIE